MMKLFVVDDESSICRSIEQIFSHIGFYVISASDADKALKIFKKERPKIVFLDIKLPPTDGFTLLQEFKLIDPDCIVFMVTAFDDELNREMATRLGASDFIKKPFSHHYLRDVVLAQIHNVLDRGGHMQKPRILIVDDERETLGLMKKTVEKAFEADIETASDGLETLKKAEAFKPDLILLDISMPRMNGLEAIPEIKKHVPDATIVVISAWNSMEVVSKASALGITDYLAKPFLPSALVEIVKTKLISMGKLIEKKEG